MKKRTMILSILFLLAGTLLGFVDTNLNLKVKFDQIYGLKCYVPDSLTLRGFK